MGREPELADPLGEGRYAVTFEPLRGRLFMTAIVRGEDFEDKVLRSARPVLVDFHAADCLPCELVAPVIEQLEADFEKRAHIVTVDIGAVPSLAERYGVQQVPCLVFFRNGKEIGRLVGPATRGTLSTLLDVVGAD